MLSEALFYKEEYAKAKKILKDIHLKEPKNSDVLIALAICNYKLGNTADAKKNIITLDNLRADYQFGEVDYALGQYYAATNNEPELYKHLLKAAANGRTYTWKYFKNDPQFKNYNKSKEFEEVMNFWK